MSDSTSTIYLISGASRGIGFFLASSILANDNHSFVYAGTRGASETLPSQLKDLQSKYTQRMAVIQCVSADQEGNRAMAKEIEDRHGRVDVVIANAAICLGHGTVFETSLAAMDEHFRINVLGPLSLFQATYHLLKNSHNSTMRTSLPRFVTISSFFGSLQGGATKNEAVRFLPYTCSKAALNWMTRKIHFENEWIVAFPICPGPARTDMLIDGVAVNNTDFMKQLLDNALDPSIVADKVMKVITASKRDTHGGQFLDADGEKLEW